MSAQPAELRDPAASTLWLPAPTKRPARENRNQRKASACLAAAEAMFASLDDHREACGIEPIRAAPANAPNALHARFTRWTAVA